MILDVPMKKQRTRAGKTSFYNGNTLAHFFIRFLRSANMEAIPPKNKVRIS